MLAALAPEKGGDPRSGEDRRHLMPVFYIYDIYTLKRKCMMSPS